MTDTSAPAELSAATSQASSSPERPVSRWLAPLRRLLRLSRALRHRAVLRGKLTMGRNVRFGKGAVLHPPQFMRLGDNVHFANGFVTEANLDIGSDVLISTRVACIGNDHAFDDATRTIVTNGRRPASTVVLEGDNLIGFGATLVGNVRIGKGCIVGAGAVVVRDLPPYTVCAGVPARPIRPRYAQHA